MPQFKQDLLVSMMECTWEMLLEQIKNAIATGQAFPISPEDRLYLFCPEEPRGQQFAVLFQEVWQGIPEGVHLAIVAFWREHAPFGRPMIEYSNQWSPKGENIRATTAAFGGEMQFLARELDPLPDDAVRFIIAHELAHVFQKARGDTLHFPNNGETLYMGADGRRRTVQENEVDADQLAESWGFSQHPLCLWELKSRRERNAI